MAKVLDLKAGLINAIGAEFTMKSQHAGYLLDYIETAPISRTGRLELFGHLLQNFGIVPANGIKAYVKPEYAVSNEKFHHILSKWERYVNPIFIQLYLEKPPLKEAARTIWNCLENTEPRLDRAVNLAKLLFFSKLIPYYPEADIYIHPQEFNYLFERVEDCAQRIANLIDGGVYLNLSERDSLILRIIESRSNLKERTALFSLASKLMSGSLEN